MIIEQTPIFKKKYKKLHEEHKKRVDEAIKTIIEDYKVGELKKGDLSEVYVYKFKIHHQLYLLAYEAEQGYRLLLSLGTHENSGKT